jgi:predicted acylesterase/phospholipase RssA
MQAPMFDAVVFAGGGNRCYWQGGFYEAAAPRLGLAPALVVGASAGAFAAIYSLLGTGAEVRARVYSGAGPHLKNFDVAAWRRGEPLCRSVRCTMRCSRTPSTQRRWRASTG